ncbi:hypothetical protein B0A53_01139 [Rhodotorula sp. CCFEE 5036]|nr:hypothetical protein B0A53_01139 [Rhodotorula sp. CCFEE 5036]
MSWLDALSQHPVWTLPPAPPSLDDQDSLGDAAAAGTPAAQARAQATISHSASSQSLFGSTARKSTPAAAPPTSPAALARSTPFARSHRHAGTRSATKDRERRLRGARTSNVAVVRGADLVVAVGSELRIASLAQVKANARADYDEHALAEKDIGEYKVLHTPTITFEIQQLVLNSTSKLLAVVGAHSVVVVVLPRRGWSTAVGKTIECRCLPIGAFYHSLPGSPSIASVLWHPLGADASSLLLLTVDCTLREYTVSEDVSEPAQVVSFSRSGPDAADKKGKGGGGARFGFSAIEKNAETAAAMCVGQGKADWGPLTLYALMRNGDVVSLCPFLPKKAAVSPSYIRGLSAFVSTKVDYLSSSLSSSLNTTITHSSSSRMPDAAAEANRLEILETRYNLQLSYVQSLSRQLSSATAGAARATIRNNGSFASEDAGDDDESQDPDAPVRITAPSRPNLAAKLQGPFLLQPAPAELDNGADDRACDLVYLSTSASSDSGTQAVSGNGDEGAAGGLGVLVLAYRDGKVDVCLEVEKPEARFVGEKGRTARAAANGAVVLRRKGFGAAALDEDDEDEHVDGGDEDDLPTLAVHESIDLGLAAELNPNEDDEPAVRAGLKHNAPRLVCDPLYPDTVYVQHALGAHCLMFGPWLDQLTAALDEPKADAEGLQALKQALETQRGTEVLWVLKTKSTDANAGPTPAVEGLVVLNDVYLGYSLLLVTGALQVVGIELSLRVDDAALDSPERAAESSPAAGGENSAYVSLLEKPKKPLEINPETLRAFATHVSTTQTAIRDLVSAADSVQSRLELQMRELSRQVDKLAELAKLRSDLGKSVSGGTEGRLRRAEEKQRELLARTDRVLQRLVESHQPSISTYERKWFDELERLEEQVVGRREGDEEDDDDEDELDETRAASLEMRAKHVEAMFAALRPGLEELKRKEEAGLRSKHGTPGRRPGGGGALGQNQVKVLEERLAEETRLLSDTKKKVDRLASSLASTSLKA